MEKNYNLVIGQGIGPAKFLMPVYEITGLFGKPDEKEESEEDGDKIITLYYDKMQTDFVFDESDDGTFVLTSLLCTNPALVLDNRIKYGATEEEFDKYGKSLKTAPPIVETDEETGEKFVCFEEFGLMGIFTDNLLTGIQLDYWEDEDMDE